MLRLAVKNATARLSAGPHHQQLVAAVAQQELHLLNQVFEALRLSLAVAIQHGLLADLLFSLAAITAALLLTDAPVRQPPGETPGKSDPRSD
jgi:hypothetical protein